MNHRHADFQSAALPLSYPGIGYGQRVSRFAKRAGFISKAEPSVYGLYAQIYKRNRLAIFRSSRLRQSEYAITRKSRGPNI